jgi:hypothetical protein
MQAGRSYLKVNERRIRSKTMVYVSETHDLYLTSTESYRLHYNQNKSISGVSTTGHTSGMNISSLAKDTSLLRGGHRRSTKVINNTGDSTTDIYLKGKAKYMDLY